MPYVYDERQLPYYQVVREANEQAKDGWRLVSVVSIHNRNRPSDVIAFFEKWIEPKNGDSFESPNGPYR